MYINAIFRLIVWNNIRVSGGEAKWLSQSYAVEYMIIDLTFSTLILNIIIYYKVIDWSLVGFVFWFNDLYLFLFYFIKTKTWEY